MKAIIFDRDGTLIVDKVYLNDPEQIEFLPNTFEGLKLLNDLGYEFFVATNQSGVPRGLVQIENLHEIHNRMNKTLKEYQLNIQKFYYAPYMTDSNHPHRKPNAGMLLDAAKDFKLDLKQSWMIGDKDVDILAGQAAGCKTILIGTNDSAKKFKVTPDFCAHDILEAALFIKNTTSQNLR